MSERLYFREFARRADKSLRNLQNEWPRRLLDIWGNCWEWTNTQISDGTYLIKGGAWDTRRDECLSEYSEASSYPSRGFDNVVFRVVRVADAGRTGTEARIWRGEEGENEGDEIMIKRLWSPSL